MLAMATLIMLVGCICWAVSNAPTLISRGGAGSLVESETRMRMARLAQRLEAYHRAEGEYPSSLDEIVAGGATDPWERRFYYERSESGYLLFSAGRDAKPRSADDIRRDQSHDADFDAQALVETLREGRTRGND